MSEVPEDEALMRLKMQPEGNLFPCCDGTEEISQSSSNDTPAPERTVCQPCSTGSQLVPPTREEDDDEEEDVVSSEVAEGLGESQEEVMEDEEQDEEDAVKAVEVEAIDVLGKEAIKSHTILGNLMAESAPVDESEAPANTKVSVEDTILAAGEQDVSQTKKVEKVVEQLTISEVVQETGGEASTDPAAEKAQPVAKKSVSEEPAHKSVVKGTAI